MVEAVLFEIRINEMEGEQIVILQERGGDRYLPIVIGICEANAIRYHVHGIQPPRPLTHDLLKNAIGALGGEILRIVVSDLSDRTFYAQIVVGTDGEEVVVDARPSDAIALAVRAGCPIFIEDHVLEKNESEGI
jgi:bifunctional DNase/RNase